MNRIELKYSHCRDYSLHKKIAIHVKDDDIGIPQEVVGKIFQPFFTTKPTGQRTGLGLSLSYDIIKAHGGEIKVISKEGEGMSLLFNYLRTLSELSDVRLK